MKKAGCFMISYGVESGCDRILRNINKNIRIDEVNKIIQITKKVGLKLRVTISIGNPGENDHSIKETVKFLNKSKPEQIGLFMIKIYPGTPLYFQAKTEGLIDDDYWFNQNNLEVPFYTKEISFDKLTANINKIRDSLDAKLINEYRNGIYSLELDLEW
jgi:radical SAM superfamily enzyme YgiQ (UPF0313 family)